MAGEEEHQSKKPNLNGNSPFLPIQIIFEILTRLSTVDSLLHCRSVCKSWRSLISDPLFIKTHHKHSTKNNRHDHRRFTFISRSNLSLRTFSLHSLLDKHSVDVVEVDNSLQEHCNLAQIVGSCNGLVCIASLTYALSFWNPYTKECRRLVYNYPEGLRCSVVYGFGYDEFTDDYKVVMIYWKNRDMGFVRVYSLRTDSWRRIQDFPCVTPLDSSGIFVNGALHWATRGSTRNWVIVSLDLAQQSYGEVEQPDYGEGNFGLSLGILGECLCVMCNFLGWRADVWVMKEYGVKESWTKLVSVPYLTDPALNWYATYITGLHRYSTLLWVSEDGVTTLLELGNQLVLYNLKHNALKDSDIRDYDSSPGVCTYIESLVSPNLVETVANTDELTTLNFVSQRVQIRP